MALRQGPLALGGRGRARDRGLVHWWNTERLHEACGYLPPTEFEAAYHQLRASSEAA